MIVEESEGFTGLTERTVCEGYCERCGTTHVLTEGPSRAYAHVLIDELDKEGRLDYLTPSDSADPRFSTEYLFGKARGQMFGVMVCADSDGNEMVMRAFSGQYNGIWEIDGWVPPVLSLRRFEEVNTQPEQIIKKIGREIGLIREDTPARRELIIKRRNLSRELMKKIHNLYELNNFRGMKRPMREVFSGSGGIPTGTGDCCAPKLLNYAARNGLRPLGITEFYYGRENRSGGRRHGEFYSSCREKCLPILGFLLCGTSCKGAY